MKKWKSRRRSRSPRAEDLRFAEALTEEQVDALRDRAERCHKWSKDPDRKRVANMSDDEAAAIMLYTQGKYATRNLFPMLCSEVTDYPVHKECKKTKTV